MPGIGITGGIGSGKSTVCRVFAILGAPVYDSDAAAKRLMNEDGGIVRGMVAILGEESYRDGVLDRRHVASRIFNDAELIGKVNSLVHPAVVRDFGRWRERMEADGAPYVLFESAILFDCGLGQLMDVNVTVSAPEELRARRVAQRDGVEIAAVMQRMRNQMTDPQREALADHVIINDDVRLVVPQVVGLDKIFRDENR